MSKVAIIKTKSACNRCFFSLLLLSCSSLFLVLLTFSFVSVILDLILAH